MKATLVVACALGAALVAQLQPYSPARYQGGGLPPLPVLAVGGGQAFVQLTIGPSGGVSEAIPLRSTPPFTTSVLDAVSGWQFSAAMQDKLDKEGKPEGPKPVPSKVLVAGVFRPPTLVTPTLGEAPKNVASAAADVAYPTAVRTPPFPPKAQASGVVLIEARVDESGKVSAAAVIGSAPPFDAPALEAAWQWRFRPARINGRATATYVYLLFGFPQPLTSPRP